MTGCRRLTAALSIAIAVVLSTVPSAQISGAPPASTRGGQRLSAELDRIINGKPALTTDLNTATGVAALLPDGFEPGEFLPATWLARTPTGGFVLEPGAWEFMAESYGLLPGSRRPNRGDGYAAAPIAGPRGNIVRHILQAAWRRPQIPQEDIQVLLWAILAHANINKMDRRLQQAAALMLTRRELAELRRGTIAKVSRNQIASAAGDLPPLTGQILDAEARVRELAESRGTYEQFARAAVPDSAAAGDVQQIPRGRWAMRRGYWVRFLPEGYQRVLVQIFVPGLDATRDLEELADAVGRKPQAAVMERWFLRPAAFAQRSPAMADDGSGGTFDSGSDAAVPGDGSGQRLGVSSRLAPDWNPPGLPPAGGDAPAPRPRRRPSPPPASQQDQAGQAPGCRDATPEQVVEVRGTIDDWADGQASYGREFDQSSSCPSSFDSDEQDQLNFAKQLAAKYHGSPDPKAAAYAACVEQNVERYITNARNLCDNIDEWRRRHLEEADRIRKLKDQFANDPQGAMCSARQISRDIAVDERPDTYAPALEMSKCTPPEP